MVWGEVTSIWSAEEIPDQDLLFVRVHRMWLRKSGGVSPGFFKNRPDERTGAMSTDWSKYSSAEETRLRARKPEDNAVGRLLVAEVRAIPDQIVVHTPIQNDPHLADNRSHTDVKGPKEETDLEIQDRFASICAIVLPWIEPE